MSSSSNVGTVEECADEMNDFIATLQRYPEMVLALTLRAHLAGLLNAMRVHGHVSSAQVRSFLEELTREILDTDGIQDQQER